MIQEIFSSRYNPNQVIFNNEKDGSVTYISHTINMNDVDKYSTEESLDTLFVDYKKFYDEMSELVLQDNEDLYLKSNAIKFLKKIKKDIVEFPKDLHYVISVQNRKNNDTKFYITMSNRNKILRKK